MAGPRPTLLFALAPPLKLLAVRPAWNDVFGRAVLLKKCWLLLARFGVEPGFTCRLVDWKLSCEGETG